MGKFDRKEGISDWGEKNYPPELPKRGRKRGDRAGGNIINE